MDALEQGQDVYDDDEEAVKEESNEDYENDSTESDEESEEDEETEEEAPKKPKKIDDEDEEELEKTTRKSKSTTKRIKTTTEASEIMESTTQKNLQINSTEATTILYKKSTTAIPKVVPHINIDGTQIAFNPKFDNTTTPETTTERELEINDIADMIFPDRKNSSTIDDYKHDGGTNEAFKDETVGKGAASGFNSSLLTLLICFTAPIFFFF